MRSKEATEEDFKDAAKDLYYYALTIAFNNFGEEWSLQEPKYLGRYISYVVPNGKKDADYIKEQLNINFDPKIHAIIPVPTEILGAGEGAIFEK